MRQAMTEHGVLTLEHLLVQELPPNECVHEWWSAQIHCDWWQPPSHYMPQDVPWSWIWVVLQCG
jgi:hypothetical protein